MKPIALLLLPALMLTSGCGKKAMTSTPTPTDITETSIPCSQLRLIRLSRYDTYQTKEQAVAQNQVIATLCPDVVRGLE